MFSRHIITSLSILTAIGSLIVILNLSSSSTPAQGAGLKAQMQQEIIQALQETVELREQALLQAEVKENIGLITPIEVREAQLKLSEVRLQLAVAQNQPNIAIKEFRRYKAMHQEQLQWIMLRAAQDATTDSSDVAEVKLQLLEQRIRLATIIRDLQ